jgi:hypothetical protein
MGKIVVILKKEDIQSSKDQLGRICIGGTDDNLNVIFDEEAAKEFVKDIDLILELNKSLGKFNSTGINVIAQERREQIEKHGFSMKNDLKYNNNELVDAAAQYLLTDAVSCWPENWKEEDYKPGDRIEELKRAGALIAAEIDRLLMIKHNHPSK